MPATNPALGLASSAEGRMTIYLNAIGCSLHGLKTDLPLIQNTIIKLNTIELLNERCDDLVDLLADNRSSKKEASDDQSPQENTAR
jgi:hypothetical protein